MARVLLSGIVVLDFVFKVEKFPDQASKYLTNDMAISLGGCAANAALAVSRLGGRASLATRCGEDLVADQLIGILNAANVQTDFVRRLTGCQSSVSSIFIDAEGERLIQHFRDPSLLADADWIEQALSAYEPNAFDAALSDTRWPEAACMLMTLAKSRGVPGVLDVEANDDDLAVAYRNASHIAFSAEGLRDYTGNPSRDSALLLASKTVSGWVCVTEGADGVYYMKDNCIMHVPAFTVDAVDTLGAGDVWHGAFALSLAQGNAELDSIYYANAVAAIKCSRFGGTVGTPDRSEVESFLKSTPLPPQTAVIQ